MAHPIWLTRRQTVAVTLLLVTGFVILPVAVYVFGQQVVGPYEGDGGLGTFLMSVYRGLAAGAAAAWLLVLSPILLIGGWYVLLKLLRARREEHAAPES